MKSHSKHASISLKNSCKFKDNSLVSTFLKQFNSKCQKHQNKNNPEAKINYNVNGVIVYNYKTSST